MDYKEFIASKQLKAVSAGFNVPLTMLNENAFEWQKLLVKWGIKKGKCAYFEDCGFLYHSEVCIWKDPVVQMQRTKALGLLHKQIKKDSAMSRQGLPEYLVVMRKPGDNPEPITHTNESFPVGEWQKYASPVWMDINPSDTLQSKSCRDEKDEKHICPLQLSVIRRAIDLWSNEGETVLTPFLGIGSESYVALERGRKTIGIELKPTWFTQAVKNCKGAQVESTQISFDV